MTSFSHMPRYDIRNDGFGPYAIFYCDECQREFRSQPDTLNTFTQDLGKSAMSGLLRKVPLVGHTVANNVVGEDPRYTYSMNPTQLDAAWKQVQMHFRECPTCTRIVCLSDFDAQSGFCNEDSPRVNEIAESRGEQAGAALKGRAAANAGSQLARCPEDGTLAAAGTKFCPECGSPMVQPKTEHCLNCGAETRGAKFCPECGTKVEPKPSVCPSCGTEAQGAKFCPECGAKIA